MTFKKINKCKDCPSCKERGSGLFYCRMMAAEKPQEMDISTCYVNPETKPEHCPWDVTRELVKNLDYKDKLSLRTLSGLFGWDNLLEPEPIKLYRRLIKPKTVFYNDVPDEWFPETDEEYLREKYKNVVFDEKYEPVWFEE